MDVSLDYVSVWIPLDDVSEKNGGLIVRPFDKNVLDPERWDTGNTNERLPQNLYDEIREADNDKKGIGLKMEAGDAVFMSSFLLHCSSPNMSSKLRRVLMLQYSCDRKVSEGKPYKYVVPCG